MTTTDTETRSDWEIAGAAWGHAAIDWAYRFEPYARDAIDQLFQTLDVGHGRALLDVACGSGYALGRAERLGASVAGVDASATLLDVATRRAGTAELVHGSMFDLPWQDETFDVVTSFNGIWGGCHDAIEEAYRVLRPGGSMAITFWGPGRSLDLRDFFITVGNAGPGVAEELIGLAQISEPGVCEEMYEKAGFTVDTRNSTSAILEFTSADDAWRCLRSPGVLVPALDFTGEEQLRQRVLASIAQFQAADGSYRLVNQLEFVIAHKLR